MNIFETHAHYDDESFNEDREQLLNELLSTDVDSIINVGARLDGCDFSVRLSLEYEKIYAAVGIHPEEVADLTEKDIEYLEQLALNNKKVVAVGEIGLDYHYPEPDPDIQKRWFRRQLQLAAKLNKPVIIHSRDACKDTIDILKSEAPVEGVIHCYSYSKESAKEFFDMGFYFGFGGVVTFKNAKKAVETVEMLPIERILLETDAPYMAPEPNRGKRNNSGYIRFVAEKIAEIKHMTAEEVIDITNGNARKLFRV
jgi:TatD DNase family protein